MSELNPELKSALSLSRFLPVIERTKTAYIVWIVIHGNLPRTQRFGIGAKIDGAWLDLLEALRKAEFAKPTTKVAFLEQALGHSDTLRFFLQLAWESKLIHTTQFSVLAKDVEEIGRMVGNWYRSMVAKTTPRS